MLEQVPAGESKGGLKTTTTTTTTPLHLGLIRKTAGSGSEQYVAHTPLWFHRVDYGVLDREKAAVLKWIST